MSLEFSKYDFWNLRDFLNRNMGSKCFSSKIFWSRKISIEKQKLFFEPKNFRGKKSMKKSMKNENFEISIFRFFFLWNFKISIFHWFVHRLFFPEKFWAQKIFFVFRSKFFSTKTFSTKKKFDPIFRLKKSRRFQKSYLENSSDTLGRPSEMSYFFSPQIWDGEDTHLVKSSEYLR